MAINLTPNSNKSILNAALMGMLNSVLQTLKIGDMLRALPTYRRGVAPVAAAANPYVLAAAQCVTLPDDAKAASITKAYARAGTGTKGPLTIDGSGDSFSGSEPAAGHIAIAPNGDILVNHTDAWTSIDFVYVPEKYDIIEQTMNVASNAIALPTTQGKALFLLEVEVTAGTATGKKIVDVPGTSSAAGHASLDLAKANVTFNAADGATMARVKWGVYSAADVDALLNTASVVP